MWSCPSCGESVEDNFEVYWSCGTSIDGVEDPYFDCESDQRIKAKDPPPPDLARPAENFVTVASCSTSPEAHAIRCHLEAAGITVFLADEFLVTMDWLLSNAVGGIKVQVPESEAERARQVLAEEADEEQPNLPQRKNVEIEERFKERKG